MTWTAADHPFVTMPVGGIGTGSVALGSDGGLRQWQLHNVGHHRGDLPGSFLALRSMQHEPVHDSTVVLQARRTDAGFGGRAATPMVDDDLVPDWQRDLVERHGTDAATMNATYPIGTVRHEVPGPFDVSVTAWSPMVPGDLATSGIPALMVDVTLANTSDEIARGWLAFSAHNAVGLDPHINPRGVNAPGYGGNVNALRRLQGRTDLELRNDNLDPGAPAAGSQMLSCLSEDVVALTQFTDPEELLDCLALLAPWGDVSRIDSAPWTQIKQTSAPRARHGVSPPGRTWLGALVAFAAVPPREQRTISFVLAWHFANRMVDFVQFGPDRPEHGATQFWLGNEYATRYPDAAAVVADAAMHREQWWRGTRDWADALEALPLPQQWRTHLAAQPVPLRTPTTFRSADGACYGFEGVLGASTRMWSGDVGGSCPLNCTHVWNYAQAPAALYPKWEASMRATELDVMLHSSGALPHRVYLPSYVRQLGGGPIGGPDAPALDGMCGAVLKVWRELRRGAFGLDWVEQRWVRIVGLLDHVAATWDPEDTGLLHGVQPSTHDIGLHGANSYMGTFWLAALRAGEELARRLADDPQADAWRTRFRKSSAALDRACFRDGHYIQVPDPDLPDRHQWGGGVLADQLIGQWWAHHTGLGYLLPVDHVRQALRTVVQYNLIDDPDARGMRPYAGNGERGLLMCTWPHGGRPTDPTLYCDEVWTGSEYQVAAHCFQEGLVDEGTAIVGALWHRHDGRRRNPFNEVECGDHYVRAMAGWSVLEARLGLEWDALEGAFRTGVSGRVPVLTGSGWGQLEATEDMVRVRARTGRLPVRRVTTPTGVYACEPITPADGWVELEAGG